MTTRNELRLLPWAGPDDKPCHLSTDDQGGCVSRLANHIEAYQLGMASQLLERARQILDDETKDLEELHPTEAVPDCDELIVVKQAKLTSAAYCTATEGSTWRFMVLTGQALCCGLHVSCRGNH